MKILIVDDSALIRDSLKILLGRCKDFDVIGTAADGQEAFEFCLKEVPDIVLMDLNMPKVDGVLGTKLIKNRFPNTKVVILSVYRDDKYIKEAIKNGASGYILKSQSTDTIIECLKIIGKGNTVFNDNVAQCIPTMLKEEKTRDLRDFDLTKREMEILALVGEGLTNKEIAEKLFLSEGTVRNNITLLLDKLNLRDRTQLALFYVNNFEHGQYLSNR